MRGAVKKMAESDKEIPSSEPHRLCPSNHELIKTEHHWFKCDKCNFTCYPRDMINPYFGYDECRKRCILDNNSSDFIYRSDNDSNN